ncbi:MAG TPA: hypothetical protein VJX92_20410 [Methylomirabilota bacterium]|nr:hypothetical protein [Methylomirabilota bacterium]
MSRRPGPGGGDAPEQRRAALLAGAVCGGLWVLLVGLVLDAASPELSTVRAMAAVWIATGLVVGALLVRLPVGSARQAWGRAAMVIGAHGLALPLAAAISFVVAGTRWSPDEVGNLELSATILGVQLAANPTAIRIGFGGFVLGLLLLAIGDRALRRLSRPPPPGGRSPS